MRNVPVFLILLGFLLYPVYTKTTKDIGKKPKDPLSSKTFMGLKFRSIGPAYTSGRIADFAVNPKDHKEYYVAAAAGNVWKTVNAGRCGDRSQQPQCGMGGNR